MKKDEFTALGISEELAEMAAAASAEELKGMVPRDRLNEVTRERDQLKTAKEKAESDLEDLKKSAGDNTVLQQQITQLQQALETEYLIKHERENPGFQSGDESEFLVPPYFLQSNILPFCAYSDIIDT